MHVDFLIGLELAGEREHVGNVAALGHGDARGGHAEAPAVEPELPE